MGIVTVLDGFAYGGSRLSHKNGFGGPSSLQAWNEKQVVVAGGSSGLGLHLVRTAAKHHAHITVLGRDIERLKTACSQAMSNGAASAQCYAIDLSAPQLPSQNPANMALMPEDESNQPFMRTDPFQDWLRSANIDLLINAVGRSDRGPAMSLALPEVTALFTDNVICSWNAIHHFLASLQRASGTIVNIGSLAGLIAAPNLGGYGMAKHALTGLTRQLRLELKPSQVHVLLVLSGPILRQDGGTRYQDLIEARGLNPASASMPGGVKLKQIDPVALSEKILRAADRRQLELVVPWKAKWLAAVAAIWPSLSDKILQSVTRS